MSSNQNNSPRTLGEGLGERADENGIAIRVQNLSKCYQIYATPRDRLKQFIVPTLCRVFPPFSLVFSASYLSILKIEQINVKCPSSLFVLE